MSDGLRVLIVADDLTGAMDTAGPFAERGLKTTVVPEPLNSRPESLAAAQVLSLDTGSRHLSPEQAASRVTECVGRFASQPFDIVFKKIDSTLRGNVVSETLALLRVCGRNAALVAPAFPAQGRTVRGAMVHVNGVPLPETGFARDALSPPPLQPLTKLFGEAIGEAKVGTWSPAGAKGAIGRSIVIADSETEADLRTALDTARPQLGRMLLVGSAGLGNALARSLGSRPARERAGMNVNGPVVFVVGSRAMQSREQVERLESLAGTMVIEAPNGVMPPDPKVGAALQIVLLAVPDGADEGDSQRVAKTLAAGALDLVRRTGSRALIATGGDTAIAVLLASGSGAVDVLGDLLPGLPYARIALDGRPLWLVTKAGGFGGRDTLYDIALQLRGGSRAAGARR
jgi:uncharacterized protein YgbK (DUF1537 family)